MKFVTDFRELYQTYADDVYRFAVYLTANATEAEDITAETFTRALTGKAPLASATVKGYLLTIARNLYLENLRKGRHFVAFPPDLPDSDHPLEQAFIQKNELEDLLAFMKTLPEEDQTALLMRADGVAYREIARELQVSAGAVKVRVHRLRLKLAAWRADHS